MSPVEVCSICGGSGWKIIERDGLSAAEKCECTSVGREQRNEERANIPLQYQAASLDKFEASGARESLKRALNDVRTYVRKYPLDLDKPGLLFVGQPGTGKTHLAVAALRGLIRAGHEGVFFDYQTLLNHIRSGYDQASGTMDREAYRTALDAEILVLDDLGAHRVTDWVEDTVTSIITHRCNNRKATIVTTNLEKERTYNSPTDQSLYSKYSLAERIGSRAYSRLFEMCKVIEMPAVEDYRQRKR
jgi:DNA replication protein DnaC